MKTIIVILICTFLMPYTVHARDAEYNMQLSDLQFSASMLEKEYEITQSEYTYDQLMTVYRQIEAMEIDKGTCPFIEHPRAKQLCNVRWRNIFIAGKRGDANNN